MPVTVDELESTTFSGRRFSRKQLAVIQETVNTFPGLSRRELGHTICEHLNWVTPKGVHKIQSCLKALEQMEQQGLLCLPAKQGKGNAKVKQKAIVWTEETHKRPPCVCELNAVLPIRIQKVTEAKEVALWNEYVDRYHYLRYRRPIGTAIRYFIISEKSGDILGCLLFSASAVWSLACRDAWIGWNTRNRKKRLNWIVTNNRFLIFPWVTIKGLASKSLSMVAHQIADDWEETHGYRPVLLETFIDSRRYKGTCYRAANWQYLGETSGKTRTDSTNCSNQTPKSVYVYALTPTFKKVLTQELPPEKRTSSRTSHSTFVLDEKSDAFADLWYKIMDIILKGAREVDATWQKRKRVINSMLIILFIFRLVFSKNKQGYSITIQELWEHCRRLQFPLPQKKPVAASAMCNARKKILPSVFKELNTRILQTYEDAEAYTWMGHRLFAVDGTKIHLPRHMIKEGYPLPSKESYYPQGLVSCLYQLKSQIPYDYDLNAQANERVMAIAHLSTLKPRDVVVYDRGYFSYAVLYRHVEKGIEGIFRLQTNSYQEIDDFFESEEMDKRIHILPSKKRQKEIRLEHPDILFRPLTLRLVKYIVAKTTFVIGTTLLDSDAYPTHALSAVYHERWGIEELYKISKIHMDVEDFHGQTERGVKQELFAHFGIVTLSRIFTNVLEQNIAKGNPQEERRQDANTVEKLVSPKSCRHTQRAPPFKINFKNALLTIARHVEALFVRHMTYIKETVHTVLSSLSACKQKVRPNRSYPRQSHKPIKKWRPSKVKSATA